jgi:hypothetical protein
MEIAKSLFSVRDHEGYVGKEDHDVNIIYIHAAIITANTITIAN